MTKEQIIETILSISRNLKLEVATKCKSEKWSADIVVNCGTYKVAFNICKSPRNVEETYKAMMQNVSQSVEMVYSIAVAKLEHAASFRTDRKSTRLNSSHT